MPILSGGMGLLLYYYEMLLEGHPMWSKSQCLKGNSAEYLKIDSLSSNKQYQNILASINNKANISNSGQGWMIFLASQKEGPWFRTRYGSKKWVCTKCSA